MVSLDIISKLKSSCIGIVIRKKENPVPLVVGGTGFVIDPEGYFITATHVIEALDKRITELKKEGNNDVKLGVTHTEISKGKAQIVTLDILYSGKMSFTILNEPYFGPKKYDLTMGRIKGKLNGLPFLKIKTPCKLDLLNQIVMCGYPGGPATLNINYDNSGMKLSPLLQTGIISGIMPIDHTTKPTGIQTDIIGTGGSSGSPIVDANDGEVIGVAQNIILTSASMSTREDEEEHLGHAQIGMIFGVSNYFLQPVAKEVLKLLKQEIDEEGYTKSGKDSETFFRNITINHNADSIN